MGIAFIIGLISGLYPAFYLPSIGVVQSLKGAFKSGTSGLMLRRSLVVFQFAISIAVVICTLLMKDQIDYVRNKELGFNKDHLLLVNIQDTLVQKQIPVIKNEMLQYSGIMGTTVAYNAPGIGVGSSVFKVETDSVMTQQAFNTLFVGEKYLETMGIKLLAGRDFNEGFEGDKGGKSFLINETAAKALGWYNAADPNAKLEDALNREIMFFHGEEPGNVVGIIQDINMSSLHNPIQPTIVVPANEEGGMFYFRLQGENIVETMDFIREKWSVYDPNHLFEYRYLDEEFDALYRAVERKGNFISILTGI
jgi:putative ABC transport system permease protein